MDWQEISSVVATAAVVATAVATGTSTLVTLWWRRNDRPEPDWILSGSASGDAEGKDDEPTKGYFSGTLTNVGDGAAFRVTAQGERCEATLLSEPGGTRFPIRAELGFMPLLTPGDNVHLRIVCDLDAWDAARVVIEWTETPTRKKKRRTHRMRMDEIAERPEIEPQR